MLLFTLFYDFTLKHNYYFIGNGLHGCKIVGNKEIGDICFIL